MRISISVAALPSFEVMISYARKSGRCWTRSEEHTSELQSRSDLVCRLLLEKKKEWKQLSWPPDREQLNLCPVQDHRGPCAAAVPIGGARHQPRERARGHGPPQHSPPFQPGP